MRTPHYLLLASVLVATFTTSLFVGATELSSSCLQFISEPSISSNKNQDNHVQVKTESIEEDACTKIFKSPLSFSNKDASPDSDFDDEKNKDRDYLKAETLGEVKGVERHKKGKGEDCEEDKPKHKKSKSKKSHKKYNDEDKDTCISTGGNSCSRSTSDCDTDESSKTVSPLRCIKAMPTYHISLNCDDGRFKTILLPTQGSPYYYGDDMRHSLDPLPHESCPQRYCYNPCQKPTCGIYGNCPPHRVCCHTLEPCCHQPPPCQPCCQPFWQPCSLIPPPFIYEDCCDKGCHKDDSNNEEDQRGKKSKSKKKGWAEGHHRNAESI
ncbi:hypothetical protein GGF37_007480, partial [Kickxella alabastrina]